MYKEKLTKKYEDRFWTYVDKTDSCWNWKGGKTNTGYGMFWTGRATIGVHRISYALKHGKIKL